MKNRWIYFISLITCAMVMNSGALVAQGLTCADADPFCTDTPEIFPNTANGSDAEFGPDYGCLGSEPNPAWYYMQVGVPGDINITISQESAGGFGLDVDFICWGPFNSLVGVCNQLTGANEVDCSYSIAAVEQCNIPNTQIGEFYILLITNFSNQPGTIDFLQTSGTGATDCNILDPCTAEAGQDANFCVGGSTVLGGAPTATGGSNIFTYTWTPAAGLDDPASANPTASPNVTTVYTLTVDDGQGCVVQDQVTVTIDSQPFIDTGPTMELNCFNSEVQLDATNTQPGTFEWTTLDGNIVSGSTGLTPVVDQAGTYTLSVISGAGCTGNADVVVTIIPDTDVTATISGDDLICQGEQTTLTVDTDLSGDWELVYSFNGADQPPIQFTGTSVTIDTDQQGVYELVEIVNPLCAGQVNGIVDLTVEPLPQLIFPDLPIQICPGDFGSVPVEVTGSGDITFTYDIAGTVQVPVTMTQGFFDLGYTEAGSFSPISVSTANCSGSVVGGFEVIELVPPSAEFTGDHVICVGEFAQVGIEFEGVAPYTFDYSLNGVYQGTNNVFTDSDVLLLDQPGQVSIQNFFDALCPGSALNNSNIAQNQLPIATISGGDTICANDDIDLIFDLVGSGEFTIDYSYNGAPQTPLVVNELQTIITVSQPGIYQIMGVSDDLCDNGVQNSTEVDLYPPISVGLQYDSQVCVGDSVVLSAVISGGQDNGYVIAWTDSSGTVVDTSFQLTAYADDHLYFAIEVNDACDIPNSDAEAFIEVQLYPEPALMASTDTVCIGEPLVFTRTSDDASISCTWTFDNGVSTQSCDMTEQAFFTSGPQGVMLASQTSAGCETVLEMDSVVFVLPDAIADFKFEGQEGTIFSPGIQFVNTTADGVRFEWDFGDGEFSDLESPYHFYPGAVSDYYVACLTSYNARNCSTDTCQIVFIEPEFLISVPNAFTPDGDGLNDLFIPVFNDIELAEYSLRIFDRFGELIFETEDQFQAWNGQGAKSDEYYARDGIYSYHITAREQKQSLKREFFGNVTVFR